MKIARLIETNEVFDLYKKAVRYHHLYRTSKRWRDTVKFSARYMYYRAAFKVVMTQMLRNANAERQTYNALIFHNIGLRVESDA